MDDQKSRPDRASSNWDGDRSTLASFRATHHSPRRAACRPEWYRPEDGKDWREHRPRARGERGLLLGWLVLLYGEDCRRIHRPPEKEQWSWTFHQGAAYPAMKI